MAPNGSRVGDALGDTGGAAPPLLVGDSPLHLSQVTTPRSPVVLQQISGKFWASSPSPQPAVGGAGRSDALSDPHPVPPPFSLRSLDKRSIPARPTLEDFVLSALARRPPPSSRRRAFAPGGRGSRFLPAVDDGRPLAAAFVGFGRGSDPVGVPRRPRSPLRPVRRRPELAGESSVCPPCSSRVVRSCSPRSPTLPSLSSPPSPCVETRAAGPGFAPPDLAGDDFPALGGMEVVGPPGSDPVGPLSSFAIQWWARPKSLLALTFLTSLSPQFRFVPGLTLPLRPAPQPNALRPVDAPAALLIGGGCQLGHSLRI
jgi:hypothetical protein